jgi:hypothetical protein
VSTNAFFLQIIAVVIGGLLLIVVRWLFTPLRWWWQNRTMRKLVEGRQEFILVYNPGSGASKTIVLHDGGKIGQGRNNNEDTWRIRRGCLEFVSDDGKLYNRFKLDSARGKLVGAADANVRALFGQYMFPQY